MTTKYGLAAARRIPDEGKPVEGVDYVTVTPAEHLEIKLTYAIKRARTAAELEAAVDDVLACLEAGLIGGAAWLRLAQLECSCRAYLWGGR